MAKRIRTVLGDIDADRLGWCQCHEHLFLEKGKSYEVSAALCMDDYDKSLQELMQYRQAGGCSYVDAQPVGAGRMAERMVKAAQASGVHIVGSTGFHKTGFYEEDSFIFSWNEEQLADLFLSELEEGMLSSVQDGEKRLAARAGIVKVAVDKGGVYGTATYEKLFRAALTAAKKSGMAVLAHFESETDAFELLKLMEEYALPPEGLIACHLDRARHDLGYHKELAQAGAFLEYDTINRLKYISNEKEIQLICGMLEAGFRSSLLFSLDTTNQRLRSYGADFGLDYILTTFSAMLAEAGVGEDTLHDIMTANAAKAIAVNI